MTRRLALTAGVAVLLASVSTPVATGQAGRQPDPDQLRMRDAATRLYDTSALHRIDIVIPDADAEKFHQRSTDRVRATFTIDGRSLQNVGVRQSGGVFHAYVPISGKPSLSLKFDEFEKGQTLFGLDKLILKNELQDSGLVNEHLAYQIFRNAGLAAPLTAHARVTINGIDSGIYLMREPIDKSFLVRNFGKGFENGDLYEIENVRDFVFEPSYPALDDEGKKGRTRQSMIDFAAAVRTASVESFVGDVSRHADLDRLVTYLAAESVTSHWDGLVHNNNTYVYRHPADDRFVFLPWGADQAFQMRGRMRGGTRSYLAQRVMEVPALAQRFSDEFTRISSESVWNERQLIDRLNQVGRILETVERTGRTGGDVNRYLSYRPFMESIITSPRPQTASLP